MVRFTIRALLANSKKENRLTQYNKISKKKKKKKKTPGHLLTKWMDLMVMDKYRFHFPYYDKLIIFTKPIFTLQNEHSSLG